MGKTEVCVAVSEGDNSYAPHPIRGFNNTTTLVGRCGIRGARGLQRTHWSWYESGKRNGDVLLIEAKNQYQKFDRG